MDTITIPKKEYEALKERSQFCETIFGYLMERGFVLEDYSKSRISEFMKEDRVSEKTRAKVKKIIKVK